MTCCFMKECVLSTNYIQALNLWKAEFTHKILRIGRLSYPHIPDKVEWHKFSLNTYYHSKEKQHRKPFKTFKIENGFKTLVLLNGTNMIFIDLKCIFYCLLIDFNYLCVKYDITLRLSPKLKLEFCHFRENSFLSLKRNKGKHIHST